MAKATQKTVAPVAARLELSTQSLQVLYQCAAQVPAANGQQAALLANALLEVEAILQERNAPQPPVVAPQEANEG